VAQGKSETVVYVSNAGDPSIHGLEMSRASGELAPIETVPIPGADQASPSSTPMAVSPDRRFLLLALRSEPFTVATFGIDQASGRLAHLGNAPLDASMAYMVIDGTGRWLLCASYPQGKLTLNAIDDSGRVKSPPAQIITDRPKAHCVVVDGANRNVYCPVLAQDIVLQLKFDAASGVLSPHAPPSVATKPGAGPRHLAFHPSGHFLYLITETTATIGAHAINPDGTLNERQFIDMLPPDHTGGIAAADLHVTPDGQFLYGSERRTSTLAGFRIDAARGTLSPIGRFPTETTPRGFAIEPRGRFLLSAGLGSNHLSVYRIGPNGALDPAHRYPMGKQPNWIEIVDLT